MTRLDGRVALVTGAGRYRGIGRAIVLRLAEEGADIVVTARQRDPSTFPAHEQEMGWKGIESVAEEVRGMGRRALALDCDVTDKEDLQRTVDAAVAELGGIDILVNNAALPSLAGAAPILEMTDENWYETVDVNLHGLYHTIRAVGREMVKGGGGSIINISSTAGRIGIPNYGAYCATKWAMHGLTQQLALELAKDNIRVNIVCPRLHRHRHDGRHLRPLRRGRRRRAGHLQGRHPPRAPHGPPGHRRGAGRRRRLPRLGRFVLHDGPGAQRRRRQPHGLIASLDSHPPTRRRPACRSAT